MTLNIISSVEYCFTGETIEIIVRIIAFLDINLNSWSKQFGSELSTYMTSNLAEQNI